MTDGVKRRAGVVGTLTLAVIAAVLLSTALASAATFTETQTDSIPPTDTNWVTPPAPPDPLVFDQFDSTKGTLTQVTITFDSALTGSMAAENTSTSSTCDVTLNWGADVTLDTTDGVLTSMLGQTENPPTLSIFDGTLDFGGTSGVTIGNLNQTDSQQAVITGAAMAPFIGGGSVTLDAAATGTSTASGCGVVVFQFITQAAVDVNVEYTFEANPAIDIEKATNGEDADTPTGPAIPVGDPVVWTYVVTNTGDVPLTQVTTVDDQGVVVTCPQDTLAVGESMTCTANGTAQLGQYANLGTTTGLPPVGPPVADEDPSHYIGVQNPAIDIEKATNGEDADTPTGPAIPVGDPVVWTYVVTNTGDVPLTQVTTVDDQGVVVTCPQDTLAVGESMTCTANGTAQLGQYANLGTTTGLPPVGPPVADEDPSHYIGEEPQGGQGCTPGYWKQTQHFWAWTNYTQGDSFAAVFGVPYDKTLLEALKTGGGQERALGRHAVAALLNAANPDVSHAFTEAQIIALVQDAWATGDFESAKNLLAFENEQGCPIGGDPNK
jgi:hypothetical protein